MVFHPSFNKDSISLKADRAEYYPNSQNIPVARSKSFQPLNIAELFGLNIERFIHTLEKKALHSQHKATAFRVFFVSLLVLGIVCAASFFLLPILGQIAIALGLSVSATTSIWQVTFLGGSLLTGFSFIPKHFIKGFEKEKLKFEQQLTLLKATPGKNILKIFLEAEFHGKYQHPKIILNTPELAELYYYSKNLNDKRLKFQQLDQQLFQINQLIKSSNLTKEEIKTLEKQIPFLRNLLQGITCEIEEVESHVQRLRHFLAQMDQI